MQRRGESLLLAKGIDPDAAGEIAFAAQGISVPETLDLRR
jgi:hypothetical protein